MNTFKKMGLFLALVLFTFAASAQRGPHHGQRSLLTDDIKEDLQLTAEQVTQIETLEAATKAKLEALHDDEAVAPENKRTQMREIMQGSKTQLQEILTPEQQGQLQAIRRQKRSEHKARREQIDHEGMRQELKAYQEENVRPIMQAQRQKLEAELSAADKATLAEIRTELTAKREEMRSERAAQRAARNERGQARDAQTQQRRHNPRGPHKGHGMLGEHKETLESMLDNYQTDIVDLLAAVEPQKEQWKADTKAIRDRYLADANTEIAREHHRRPHGGDHTDKRAQHEQIRFLLMDPNKGTSVLDDTAMNTVQAVAYPNPATNNTTLTFDLPQAATVRIELRNEQGLNVKTISRDSFAAGKNEVLVDLSDVDNGTYYLSLNSRALSAPASVKVVVVK